MSRRFAPSQIRLPVSSSLFSAHLWMQYPVRSTLSQLLVSQNCRLQQSRPSSAAWSVLFANCFDLLPAYLLVDLERPNAAGCVSLTEGESEKKTRLSTHLRRWSCVCWSPRRALLAGLGDHPGSGLAARTLHPTTNYPVSLLLSRKDIGLPITFGQSRHTLSGTPR